MKSSKKNVHSILICLLMTLALQLHAQQRPTAAVAIGDSFISGEGASFDDNGYEGNFPGWSADNNDPFFCHRSPNASIHQAELPGIQARFNFACSGGQPSDVTEGFRTRRVAAQVDQLLSIAETHDIKLILVGLGSNNRQFTFGLEASMCVANFFFDAYFTAFGAFFYDDLLEYVAPAILPPLLFLTAPVVTQDPCDPRATVAELLNTQEDVAISVASIIESLDTLRDSSGNQLYPPGSYRIVMQDYTNPLPTHMHSRFISQSGDTESSPRFQPLAWERYAGGCPIHSASLASGHDLSEQLGVIVEEAAIDVAGMYPDHDIVYLNVQNAFDGARLCENDDSPNGTLATPVRFRNSSGAPRNSLDGLNKFQFRGVADNCDGAFQRCQESWHPNAQGHNVLGQCLSGAAETDRRVAQCFRNTNFGTIFVHGLNPHIEVELFGDAYMTPINGQGHPTIDVQVMPAVRSGGIPPTRWKITPVMQSNMRSVSPNQINSDNGWFTVVFNPGQTNVSIRFNLEADVDGTTLRTNATYSASFAVDGDEGGGSPLDF